VLTCLTFSNSTDVNIIQIQPIAHNEALLTWTIKHHQALCSNNSTSHTKISQRETRLIISYPQKLLAGFFLVILCLSQQPKKTRRVGPLCNSDRSPFCRDTCWESWLRGSEVVLRDSWHGKPGRRRI